MDRFDKPREALEWYLQKRLPRGEKVLPIERYFAALNDFLANIAVTVPRGAGVFKTNVAGVHWTQLASTISNSNFFFINDIVVSPANGRSRAKRRRRSLILAQGCLNPG